MGTCAGKNSSERWDSLCQDPVVGKSQGIGTSPKHWDTSISLPSFHPRLFETHKSHRDSLSRSSHGSLAPNGSNPSSSVLRWEEFGRPPPLAPAPYLLLLAGRRTGTVTSGPAPSPAPHSVQTSTAYPRHHWTVRRTSGADWLASPSVRTKALITRPRASRGRARVRARRGLRLQVKRQFSGPSMGVLGGISGRTGKGYCASCPSACSVPCDGVALMSSGWDPSRTGSPRWAASRVGDTGLGRWPFCRP